MIAKRLNPLLEWSRIFSIVAGVIEIGLSLMIMAAPVIGAELVSILLAIALLIVGIQIIAAGVSGTRFAFLEASIIIFLTFD